MSIYVSMRLNTRPAVFLLLMTTLLFSSNISSSETFPIVSPSAGQIWSAAATNVISSVIYNVSSLTYCDLILFSSSSSNTQLVAVMTIATDVLCGDNGMSVVWDVPANITTNTLSNSVIQCSAALINQYDNDVLDTSDCDNIQIFIVEWSVSNGTAQNNVSSLPFIIVKTSTDSANWTSQLTQQSQTMTYGATFKWTTSVVVYLSIAIASGVILLASLISLLVSTFQFARSSSSKPANDKMSAIEFAAMTRRPTAAVQPHSPEFGQMYTPNSRTMTSSSSYRDEGCSLIATSIVIVSAIIMGAFLAAFLMSHQESTQTLTSTPPLDAQFNVIISPSVVQAGQPVHMSVICSSTTGDCDEVVCYSWLFSDDVRMTGSTAVRSFDQIFGNNFILIAHSACVNKSDLITSLVLSPQLTYSVFGSVKMSLSVVELAVNATIAPDDAVIDCSETSLTLSQSAMSMQMYPGTFVGISTDAKDNNGEYCPQLYYQIVQIDYIGPNIIIEFLNATVMDIYSSAEIHVTAAAAPTNDDTLNEIVSDDSDSLLPSWVSGVINDVASFGGKWELPGFAAAYTDFTATFTPTVQINCQLSYTIRWKLLHIQYVSLVLTGSITPAVTTMFSVARTFSTPVQPIYDSGDSLPTIRAGAISITPKIVLALQDIITFDGGSNLVLTSTVYATYSMQAQATWDPDNGLQHSPITWNDVKTGLTAPTISQSPCSVLNQLNVVLTLEAEFEHLVTLSIDMTRSYYAELAYPAGVQIGKPLWDGIQSCSGDTALSTTVLYSSGHSWSLELGLTIPFIGTLTYTAHEADIKMDSQLCFPLPQTLVTVMSVCSNAMSSTAFNQLSSSIPLSSSTYSSSLSSSLLSSSLSSSLLSSSQSSSPLAFSSSVSSTSISSVSSVSISSVSSTSNPSVSSISSASTTSSSTAPANPCASFTSSQCVGPGGVLCGAHFTFCGQTQYCCGSTYCCPQPTN